MPRSDSDTGDRERRLNDLIAQYYLARERGEQPDREAFLAANSEFAAELRDFFAGLGELEAAAGPDWAGNQETADASPSASRAPRPGVTVRYFGDYEILEEIGSGGMGLVFKARQTRLKRIVALKMIRSGAFASESEVRRFQGEARAAAKLEHPQIVSVHEVGTHENFHYFTMDYLAGGTLADLIRRESVTALRAAGLVAQIAKAIHYAHQQGVLHRDLKPGNVLLTLNGEPRVSDFGLAKRLVADEDETDLVSQTETGQVIGTAGYMPPEQATGKSQLVGPPADIYGLGAILYSLLTTRAPFVGDSQAAVLLQVLHQEPVPPRLLNPNVPRDLETIVLKCLRKEPHERYGTAQLLAEDLERFMDGRPVLARRVSVAERALKWCRRNPLVASLTAAVACSLLAGGLISLNFAKFADEKHLEAKRFAGELEKTTVDKDAALGAAELERRAADDAKRIARESDRKAARQRYTGQLMSLWDDFRKRDFGKVDQFLIAATPQRADDFDFRGWEWRYLRAQVDRQSRRLNPSCNFGQHLTYCARTDELAVQADGKIEIWRLAEHKQLRTLTPKFPQSSILYFSPDGRRLAYSTWADGAVIIDAATGETVHEVRLTAEAVICAWSGDGTRFAVGSRDGKALLLLDTTTWRSLPIPQELAGTPIWAIAFHPDSRTLCISGNSEVILWDTTGTELIRHPWPAAGLVWNSTGERLAASCFGRVVIGNRDGLVLQEIKPLEGLAVTAWIDDDHLAVAAEHRITVWNVPRAKPTRELRLHGSPVTDMAVFRDRGDVVTAAGNGDIRLWNAFRELNTTEKIHVAAGALPDLAWSESGKELYVAEPGGRVSHWDVTTRRRLGLCRLPTPERLIGLHVAAGKLFCAQEAGAVSAIDIATMSQQPVGSLQSRTGLGCSPDGKFLGLMAVNGTGQAGVIVEAASGKEVWRAESHECLHLVFSPQGDRVADCRWGWMSIVDLPSLHMMRAAESRKGVFAHQVAWRPDGLQLAEANDAGQIVIYLADDQQILKTLEAHQGAAMSVQWSRDGKRIATAGKDKTVRLWDAETFTELGTITHPDNAEFQRLAWSPDDQSLAATSADGSVLVWSTRADETVVDTNERILAGAKSALVPAFEFREVSSASLHKGVISALAFNRSGQIATVGADRKAKVFNLHKLDGAPLVEFDAADDKAHEQAVKFLARGAKMLLAWHGAPGTLQLWHWPQRELIWEKDVSTSYVAVSPDEELLVTANWESPELRVMELATGREVTTLFGVDTAAATRRWLTSNVAFAPDGKSLISVCGGTEDDSAPLSLLRVWNRATWECEQEFSVGPLRCYGLELFPQGDRIVFSGTGGRVAVLKVTPTGPEIDRGAVEQLIQQTLSDDRDTRLTALRRLRELGPQAATTARRIAGQPIEEIELLLRRSLAGVENEMFPVLSESLGRVGTVMATAVNRDGNLVATAGRVYQKNQGEITVSASNRLQSPLFRWTGPGAMCIAFSPDDRYLAAGLQDGTIRVWEIVRDSNPAPHPELAALTAEIQRAPHLPEFWLKRGDWHIRRQDWRTALTDFTEGCRADATDPACAARAAVCHAVLGDHAAHRATALKLVELLKSHPHLDEMAKYRIVHSVCLGRNCFEDYEPLAELASRLAENSNAIHLLRARLYSLYRARRWEEAVEMSERMEAQKPSSWELVAARSIRALSFHHMNRPREAKLALDQAEVNYKQGVRPPGELLANWQAFGTLESTPVLFEARETLGISPPVLAPQPEAETPAPIRLLTALEGHQSFNHGIRLVNDGRTAFSGGHDGRVLKWDLVSGAAPELLGQVSPRITALAVDPNRRRVFAGKSNGEIEGCEWLPHRAREKFSAGGKYLHGLTWWNDQNGLLAASGGDVRLWKFAGKTPASTVVFPAGALRVGVGVDQTVVVAGSDGHIHFVDLHGAAKFPPQSTGGIIQGLAIAPDGKLALTCGGEQFEDSEAPGIVALWDVTTGRRVRSLHGHRGLVNEGEFTADGKFVVTGGRNDRTLRMWNTATGLEIARGTARSRCTNYLAITPDNKYVLSGGGEHRSASGWPSDGEHRLFLWELPDVPAP